MTRITVSAAGKPRPASAVKFSRGGKRKRYAAGLSKASTISTKRKMLRTHKKASASFAGPRTAEICYIDSLLMPSGIEYPLHDTVIVQVSIAKKGFRASCHPFNALAAASSPNARPSAFAAFGSSPGKALESLTDKFHRIVVQHRLPSHDRTEENRRVNVVLDQLVDWDKFHAQRSVRQPLWGQLLGLDDDGSARVAWHVGLDDLQTLPATIAARDVPAALRDLGPGRWFYGVAELSSTRIKWLREPVEVPDPNDEAARKAAWDLIPVETMSDPKAWPLKGTAGATRGDA